MLDPFFLNQSGKISDGIGAKFSRFLKNLELTDSQKQLAITRHTSLRKNLESEFAGAATFIGGSYAKNTAIRPPTDLDIMLVLPQSYYDKYSGLDYLFSSRNGQSELLQEVKRRVGKYYKTSHRDLEETRQRTGAYSVYSVDDPSLIPQGYVSAAISNYYFFANPSAPSGQLITLRNELVEMKSLAKISGIKQFLPQISSFLTQGGYYYLNEKDLVGTTQEVQPEEAQAEEVVEGEEIAEALEVNKEVVSNALTVEQYLEKINKNEAILQQIIQIVYQNTQMNITPLVQKAAGLQSNIKTVLEKAVNEGNGAMKVSEFLTLLAPAEQIAGLKQALFQDLTQAMDQALNATRAYSSNPDEKDAQIDALSKVIMSL